MLLHCNINITCYWVCRWQLILPVPLFWWKSVRLVGSFTESSLRKMGNIVDHKTGNMTGRSSAHFFCCHRGKLLVLFLRITSLWCVVTLGRNEVAHTAITQVGFVSLLTAQTRLKCGSGCLTMMVWNCHIINLIITVKLLCGLAITHSVLDVSVTHCYRSLHICQSCVVM